MASTFSIHASGVDGTFGCLFIAVIISSALWGAGCLQYYYYCEHFWKTEQRWLKLYISSLWILDTVLQTCIAIHFYESFVKSIANPSLLLRIQKSPHITILSAFIICMIQFIFVQRAWHLSNKNRILVGALSLAVLAQLVLSIVFAAQSIRSIDVAALHSVAPVELGIAGVSAFTDTFLAVVLSWLLLKSRSGLKRSDSIVHRLVIYILGSSCATAICMMTSAISAAVAPYSFVHLLCGLLVTKLYFNCLLASLNARSRLRASAETRVADSPQNLTFSFGGLGPAINESDKPAGADVTMSGTDVDIETGASTTVGN